MSCWRLLGRSASPPDLELLWLQRIQDVDAREVAIDVAADRVKSPWPQVTEVRTIFPWLVDGEHGYGASHPLPHRQTSIRTQERFAGFSSC